MVVEHEPDLAQDRLDLRVADARPGPRAADDSDPADRAGVLEREAEQSARRPCPDPLRLAGAVPPHGTLGLLNLLAERGQLLAGKLGVACAGEPRPAIGLPPIAATPIHEREAIERGGQVPRAGRQGCLQRFGIGVDREDFHCSSRLGFCSGSSDAVLAERTSGTGH